MTKYSIIIPVYNSELYIEECLKSIINQSYKNFEVIIINDGSTDNSEKMCKEYANNDERIKLFSIPNSGVSNARNLGISKAIGEYILFVDSDDFCEENMLETIDKAMLNNIELLCFGYIKEYVNKKEKRYIQEQLTRKDLLKEIICKEEVSGYLWNKVFCRKNIIEYRIRFNEEVHYCEDLLFVLEYLKIISEFKIISDCLYHYRMRKNSVTFDFYNKKNITILDAYNQLIKEYENEEYIHVIQYQYIKSYYRLKKLIKKNNYNRIRKDCIDDEKKILKYVSLKEKLKFYLIKYCFDLYLLISKLKKVKELLYD